MEDSRLKADQLQRDQRLKEKEKSKDIGEELRKVCDGGGGGVLMEEVQSRKKEITNDLEKMRKDADVRTNMSPPSSHNVHPQPPSPLLSEQASPLFRSLCIYGWWLYVMTITNLTFHYAYGGGYM